MIQLFDHECAPVIILDNPVTLPTGIYHFRGQCKVSTADGVALHEGADFAMSLGGRYVIEAADGILRVDRHGEVGRKHIVPPIVNRPRPDALNDAMFLPAWCKRHQIDLGGKPPPWISPEAAAELVALPGFPLPPTRLAADYTPPAGAEVIVAPSGRVLDGVAVLAYAVAHNRAVQVNIRVEH